MNGDAISSLLDDYLDGTLSPADRARVEAHLLTCDACRAELAALRSILADARALPRSVLPARDLWDGIAARIGEKESLKVVSRSNARGTGWRITPYRVPLLAAAAVLLMLGGALLARLLQPPAPASSTFAVAQQRYSAETASLAQQLSRHPDALPEATRAVVERNLAIVDEAIHEAEQALTTDPGNTALEQMVLARYEQRLALLTRATQAGRRST